MITALAPILVVWTILGGILTLNTFMRDSYTRPDTVWTRSSRAQRCVLVVGFGPLGWIALFVHRVVWPALVAGWAWLGRY